VFIPEIDDCHTRMLRALASLFFYVRFFHRFSRIGLRRRQRQWSAHAQRFDGQTWLVTGASGGIGAAIAGEAHARGARVLAAARSPEKLGELVRSAGGSERMQALRVDFSSVADTRRLVQDLTTRGERIDVLVNNVGLLLDRFERTPEGFESSFVTNLLSHFVLTEGLHAGGRFSDGAAVINMSSGGMYGSPLRLSEMAAAKATDHDGMAAYAMHKRAQLELTRAWNRRWQGQPRAYVMHPGWVDTPGVQTALPWFRATLRRFLRSADEAADTALWLGGTRPPVAADGGIWLDRVRDPEHAFAMTRQTTADAEQLHAFLDAQVEAAQSTSVEGATP
jgi:dehydrogenase/reductase SDR family protein 12